MRNYFSVTQLFLALLVLAVVPGVLQARSDRTIEDSGLFFSVIADRNGFFSLATVDAAQEVLRYELADLTVSFTLADQDQSDFDNPLFCFDFGSSVDSSIKVRATNSSGHLVLDERGLSSDLEYQLNDSRFAFTPSGSTQCFYVGSDGTSEVAEFGLFGVAPVQPADDPNADDLIFADRFELIENRSVRVSFEGVPDSVVAGETFSYDILIQNTGDAALDQLAFQEVFPGNATYFPAALAVGEWTCEGTACPAQTDTTPIRLDSISLPVDGSIRYQVSRTVDAGSTGGSTLVLYAGAVDGAGQEAPFDVAQAEIPVVGVLQQFEVSFTEASPIVTAGGVFPEFTIRAVDSGGNTIKTFDDSVGLTLRSSTATLAVLTTSITWVDGLATISNLDVPSDVEGTDRLIRVEFGDVTGDSATFDIAAP